MDTQTDLTVSEIFEGLPPDTLEDFEALGYKSCYPPGIILFGAGDRCSGIFWVCSGPVSVTIPAGGEESLMSHIARAGELLGLEAALCGETYGTTARTEGPCDVVFMSQAHLSTFLSTHADAAFHIVQRLSKRLGVVLEQLRSASTADQQKRPN